jgi:PAS domain S-box-containing protein
MRAANFVSSMHESDDKRSSSEKDPWVRRYPHAQRNDGEHDASYFRALFEDAPAAYIITDADFTIIDANRAAQDLTSRRLDQLLGKPLSVIVPPSDTSAFRSILDEVRARMTVNRPVRVITRDGREQECSFIAKAAQVEENVPGSFYCLFCTKESDQADMI